MIRTLSLLLICASLSSCYVIRAYKVRHFKLSDPEHMPFAPVSASSKPFEFSSASELNQYQPLHTYLDTALTDTYTAAFLVIRNDSILYEKYFDGFDRQSKLPSFSVAKSFVATLVGIAIDEGRIGSTNDAITTYLPELIKTDPLYANVRLQDLLDMQSGLKFDEGDYGLKDAAIKLGFRPNVRKRALKVKTERPPGTFDYQSINTELLALAVEAATGKSIVQYLEEKLWHPMGAESAATWTVDSRKRKEAIAFAGLNATARDFAKLGRLYLNRGSWNGVELVSRKWIDKVMEPDSIAKWPGYKNQWWERISFTSFKTAAGADEFKSKHSYATSVLQRDGAFVVGTAMAPHATGILNQYIYLFPESNTIIVRLGHSWKHSSKNAERFIRDIGFSL